MNTGNKNYTLIVNLDFASQIGRHIPLPYIVRLDKDNVIGSLRAQATVETFEGYNINFAKEVVLKTITLCAKLSMDSLEGKYCRTKSRKNGLAKLLSQDLYKKEILNYFDRSLDVLFSELEKYDIPLVVDIPRKTRLEDLKVVPAQKIINPLLKFEKTQLGIKYFLKLGSNENYWSPMQKDVVVLSDAFPWIIVDYKYFKLNTINGNKLTPFLKKDYIFIRSEFAVTYFEKFILEVAKKVEIEAVGFDVIYLDEIQNSRLESSYDFVNDVMLLDLVFSYEGSDFSYGAATKNRTRLNISKDGKISIIQIRRNRDEEALRVKKLLGSGLSISSSNRFGIEGADDGMEIIKFLVDNKIQLKGQGFEVNTPELNGKKINLGAHKLVLKSNAEQDWFDIHGVIEVGPHRIPFAHLLKYINEKDRMYPLEDDTYFVIPLSWMSKYEELAKFGEKVNDSIRIKKAQYKVIEDIEKEDFSGGINTNMVEAIEYVPSPNLNATLRPYQTEGVEWLLRHQANGLGACLADDMGLGKTLQTIAVLSYTKDHLKRKQKSSAVQLTLFADEMMEAINPLRALIVLPASLIFNWFEEIKKFNPSLHTLKYIGGKRKKSAESLDKFDVVLTTYHTVLRDVEIFNKITWEYIVLDESQMIKNKDSKMFRAVNQLDAVNKLSLSGTPIENSLSDLWSQMQFINPDMLGNFTFFKSNFLTPIEKQQDQEVLAQLVKMIKPFILRRTKEEVAKDLPPMSEKIEYIDMEKDQKEVYDKVKSATRNHLLGMDAADRSFKFHVFAALTKLRQLANDPTMIDEDYSGVANKIEYVLSQMDVISKSGHKVLLFSSFTKLIRIFTDACEKRSWKYEILTGANSQKQRATAVAKFQDKKDIPFFFISLKAGGTGLNLTAADYVFILDPWWNPFAEKQAIARAHRIGQDKPVTVIRYITKDTIEEKILKLQEKKKSLSDDILHLDEEKINLAANDLRFILE